MEELVEIVVDGRSLTVSKSANVLQALRDHGIDIPALCYYPALEAYASCGLCMVEIWSNAIWNPRHACLLEVEDGLQITTVTPRLQRLRSWAAKILLRGRPFHNSEAEDLLLKLVQGETADGQVLSGSTTEGCILCGLCIRMCRKIGKNRLTYLGRGKNLRIGLVPGEGNKATCGNCSACRDICPMGFISPDAEHAFKARLYKE
ncbi:NADP-reducing hydrogenase subunit HndC [Sporomusa ovata DSM 2662]|uniref:Periplasmic [Fe] hydrogenase large subunit n=1 Tax=Sporomusa ovata TaxID=2378 RepID=A0A0U1KUI0_9FIRM|nr:2Fe-2S iron-sulfur cluster-binding protein [Sporomusa ovata]EQB26798.1 hydrogenase subunit HymC [Sporomusa ovata DSM 2662]CQR70895.1 Periplasmic [Fe] hydrogenase large subunit [Sporomusa ovata]